jgi:Fic family protein
MLKEKYWLTEYMSISRVIAKSKHSYEKAFLYTECDELDLGYFVSYNLRVLNLSFLQLKSYIEKKQRERRSANAFMMIGNINEREAQIIQYFNDKPNEIVTVKEMQNRFGITAMTARKDLVDLVAKGYLSEININNVKKGYIKSSQFDEIVLIQAR